MERKFVCKFCFKRFACGKSLGGHIRTHITQQRTKHHSNILSLDAKNIDSSIETVAAAADDAGNGNANSVYGLRENPKKTMRFVHSNHQHHHVSVSAVALEQRDHDIIKFCKECGKGFPSLKALCGHMASHSDKDHKKISYKENLFIAEDDDDDEDDDSTQSGPNIRKSKRRMRFKSLILSNQPSSSVNNDSFSEVEQEQQEVAMCLILLSRDFFSHKGRFVFESSDNNSVVLETKSSSRLCNKNIVIRNGSSKIKIVDSNVSNYDFKRAKVEQDHKSRFEDCRSKYNVKNTKDMDRDKKFDSRKKVNYEGFGFSNKNELYENGRKYLKYEWLGSEKNNGGNSYDSTTDDADGDENDEENSSESDSFSAAKKKASNKGKKKLKSKKSKEYECPICYKIFRSGQALGGHKRSHFVGGSEHNTFVIKQSNVPCFIDLNLPAPFDE